MAKPLTDNRSAFGVRRSAFGIRQITPAVGLLTNKDNKNL